MEIYGKVTGEITLEEGCVVNEYVVADLQSLKKANLLGSKCKQIKLAADITTDGFFNTLQEVNIDLNQHTLTLDWPVDVTKPVVINNGKIIGKSS